MKRKILLVSGASILLGLVFDFLFYGKVPGISVFIFTAAILAVTGYLAGQLQRKISATHVTLGVAALFFAFMFYIRASGWLLFLDSLFLIYLLLMIVEFFLHPEVRLQEFTFNRYLIHMVRLPFLFVGKFFQFFGRLSTALISPDRKRGSWSPILRGIIISLPILFIFLILLSSADLVFKKYVGSLLDFHISSNLFGHLLLIGFITSLFMGAYALLFVDSREPDVVLRDQPKVRLGSTEASVVLGLVTFLFLVFVLIQITYLFGGQNTIISTGYTYAEYARKGFFELIAVAVLSFGLLLVMNRVALRETLQQKMMFMWLSGVLIIEVLVIMLSAHKRLSLYEQAYGFTVLRLISHIFIAWLAVVFVMLAVSIIREQKENQLAFGILISMIAFMVFTNLMNPEAFIARENIQRLHDTGKVDISYLSSLSADATPQVARLLNDSNADVSKTVAFRLYYKQADLTTTYKHWQSNNRSIKQAQQLLKDHQDTLEANKDFNFIPGKNVQ